MYHQNLFHVSPKWPFFLFHVSPLPCFMYHLSCFMYHPAVVSCITFFVSCITSISGPLWPKSALQTVPAGDSVAFKLTPALFQHSPKPVIVTAQGGNLAKIVSGITLIGSDIVPLSHKLTLPSPCAMLF
jgi:hypothetical protein